MYFSYSVNHNFVLAGFFLFIRVIAFAQTPTAEQKAERAAIGGQITIDGAPVGDLAELVRVDEEARSLAERRLAPV